MNHTTENTPSKAGLFARLWKPTAVSTVSPTVQNVPVTTRNRPKQSENVPKTTAQKLMPGIGSLRLQLMRGERKTVGELAGELGITMVQASRLISKAEAAGHVTKQKVGRCVIVSIVPIGQLTRK